MIKYRNVNTSMDIDQNNLFNPPIVTILSTLNICIKNLIIAILYDLIPRKDLQFFIPSMPVFSYRL